MVIRNIKKIFSLNLILFSCIAFSFVSCGGGTGYKNHVRAKSMARYDKKTGKYNGHYKAVPHKTPWDKHAPHNLKKYKEKGMASWYGTKKMFHGWKTANGDVYNMNELTAAHRYLPIPCMIRVVNLENKKSVIVMVNDRGPYVKGRILDLSPKAASILGFKDKGLAKVGIQYLPIETKRLLTKLALKPKHGARPHGKIRSPSCDINCHVKLANRRYGFRVN